MISEIKARCDSALPATYGYFPALDLPPGSQNSNEPLYFLKPAGFLCTQVGLGRIMLEKPAGFLHAGFSRRKEFRSNHATRSNLFLQPLSSGCMLRGVSLVQNTGCMFDLGGPLYRFNKDTETCWVSARSLV